LTEKEVSACHDVVIVGGIDALRLRAAARFSVIEISL
jgi:hypothetical protein